MAGQAGNQNGGKGDRFSIWLGTLYVLKGSGRSPLQYSFQVERSAVPAEVSKISSYNKNTAFREKYVFGASQLIP
jgi:hypothetical protein